MPRLTNPDYLKRHYFVAALWDEPATHAMFGHLSPSEQWDVHGYYQSDNFHADDLILQVRVTLTEKDPSLPQRAGRAYAELLTYYTAVARQLGVTDLADLEASVPRFAEAWTKFQKLQSERSKGVKPKRTTGPSRHRIQAIANSHIDGEKFAKALLMLVMEMDEERKREGKP